MTELKFGERIKRIRATQKLTQQAFADKVGVSKATVNSWENNGKFPAVDTAAKIADAFGVSLDWLCGIEDKAARKMETYGDLFAALNEIVVRLGDSIFSMARVETETNDFTSRPWYVVKDGILRFDEEEMGVIFNDWSQILELHKNNIINSAMYNAWIESRCRLLSKYSLDITQSSSYEKSVANLISDWQAGENRTEEQRKAVQELISAANTEAHHEQESE